MMSDEDRRKAADSLLQAEKERKPVVQLSKTWPAEPGRVMLSGSFIRPVWAQRGDTLRADFGAHGGLAVQFV